MLLKGNFIRLIKMFIFGVALYFIEKLKKLKNTIKSISIDEDLPTPNYRSSAGPD